MSPQSTDQYINPCARIWVHSDLQLSSSTLAEKSLSTAVEYPLQIDLNLDAIWCLGDVNFTSISKQL